MFENDFLMREIENFTRFAKEVLFKKREKKETVATIEELSGKAYDLKRILFKMIKETRINEAENMLFDAIDEEPSEDNLKVALDFYHELSMTPSTILSASNFQREEILEGLHEVQKIYGVNQDLLDLFSKTN